MAIPISRCSTTARGFGQPVGRWTSLFGLFRFCDELTLGVQPLASGLVVVVAQLGRRLLVLFEKRQSITSRLQRPIQLDRFLEGAGEPLDRPLSQVIRVRL